MWEAATRVLIFDEIKNIIEMWISKFEIIISQQPIIYYVVKEAENSFVIQTITKTNKEKTVNESNLKLKGQLYIYFLFF